MKLANSAAQARIGTCVYLPQSRLSSPAQCYGAFTVAFEYADLTSKAKQESVKWKVGTLHELLCLVEKLMPLIKLPTEPAKKPMNRQG